MLNSILKILLVSTSLSPILLTYWFAELSKAYQEDDATIKEFVSEHYHAGIEYLLPAIFLLICCLAIINVAKRRLETLPINISTIKTADRESLGFILVYLLPLANTSNAEINVSVLIFVAILFFLIVFTSNAYHFNPLLSFFGYHFYEVTTESGITYILITRKNITNGKKVKSIVQLSEYMILET